MTKIYYTVQKSKDQSPKASETPIATPKEYSEDGFGTYHDK